MAIRLVAMHVSFLAYFWSSNFAMTILYNTLPSPLKHRDINTASYTIPYAD